MRLSERVSRSLSPRGVIGNVVGSCKTLAKRSSEASDKIEINHEEPDLSLTRSSKQFCHLLSLGVLLPHLL